MDTIVLLTDFNYLLYSGQCGDPGTYQRNTGPEEATHPRRATAVHHRHIHSNLGEIYLSMHLPACVTFYSFCWWEETGELGGNPWTREHAQRRHTVKRAKD